MTDVHAPYKAALNQAKAEAEDRRKRLLAWPNLAAKLTDYPLRYAQPEHWTGYIPPAHTGTGAINDSPARVALIKLWTEVLDAESKGEPPATEEPPDDVEGPSGLAHGSRSGESLHTYHEPPTEPPHLPVDIRERDIDDVPLPDEPPEEDW